MAHLVLSTGSGEGKKGEMKTDREVGLVAGGHLSSHDKELDPMLVPGEP